MRRRPQPFRSPKNAGSLLNNLREKLGTERRKRKSFLHNQQAMRALKRFHDGRRIERIELCRANDFGNEFKLVKSPRDGLLNVRQNPAVTKDGNLRWARGT